jgi:hypothetical protein
MPAAFLPIFKSDGYVKHKLSPDNTAQATSLKKMSPEENQANEFSLGDHFD